ncbi:MAG: hypothetical protein GAK45_00389 [Pseudomonas citronellolis]|nr:MAG: hypothetical protein GAK45_00389 [Pseudomonas citronellolis]
MEERRQYPRHAAGLRVEVFDRYSGRSLGRVADLSSEGFMLCGDAVPAADSVHECLIVPLPPLSEVDEIIAGVDCLWSRPGQNGQLGWAGFHIIDLSDDQSLALERLIALL